MTHRNHQERFSLDGRTALVTGSARGLGWEIARAMAEAGAHVVLNGRDAGALETRVNELSRAGLSAEAVVLDVADQNAVATWHEDLEPMIDILVNNVGMRIRRRLAEIPPGDFDLMLRNGLVSAYGLSRILAPGMIGRGGGAIINVTSIAGPLGKSNDSAYVATKAGLEGLTRGLATELGPEGIRTNGIAPGFFRTEANTGMAENEAVNRWLEMRAPLKRWAEPSEIAGAAVFLASPATSYVNGHILTVDGGLSTSF